MSRSALWFAPGTEGALDKNAAGYHGRRGWGKARGYRIGGSAEAQGRVRGGDDGSDDPAFRHCGQEGLDSLRGQSKEQTA